jgi:hypothetical protein
MTPIKKNPRVFRKTRGLNSWIIVGGKKLGAGA